MSTSSTTHEVFNQSPPFCDLNLYETDLALKDAVAREGGSRQAARLSAFGAIAGSAEMLDHGRLANEHPPKLRTHDARGFRIDVVEYHPSYHALMRTSIGHRLHASTWGHLASGKPPSAGAHVARAAAFYLATQMEAGHCCPVTMTHASVATIALAPADIADAWIPKLLSASYDPSVRPAIDKSGLSIGMGMTEKQGGTDVRANTTRAQSTADGSYLLDGHKWFLSAPMSDAYVVLAQAPGGLSCFLLPRLLTDGTANGMRLQRLKEKLGNRSNASAEVEFHDAHAWLIGEEGRGVATIMEMVSMTRLDCAISSAALMRLALAHAMRHGEHRTVMGNRLVDLPLMRHVLADMALDVEAATALSLRLARSFDRTQDPKAAAWKRLMTPVTKYWVCRIAPALIYEALECCGGNGYVEELPLARLYREAPVNAIWEGSGNVMGLDLLRVLQREPEAARIVLDDLYEASRGDTFLEAAQARVEAILHDPRLLDLRARELAEGFAKLAAGTILRAHSPPPIADTFIATRLGQLPRQSYGQGLERADLASILSRASPARS